MFYRQLKFFHYQILSLLFINITSVTSLGEVIYAINSGGNSHTDVYGVKYERDPLFGKVGTPSDYGKQLIIGRIRPEDQILYQTERYHHNTFGYDIPIDEDGEYVMVLKFCEVYFNAPNMKVFDVVLNGDHTIVADLDIFDRVGRGVAHDEYVPFQVKNGRLIYNGEESDIRGGKIRVEFIKGYRDNPKINAIFVVKGKLDDVPKLESIGDTEEWARPGMGGSGSHMGGLGGMNVGADDQLDDSKLSRNRRTSGPRTPNPYASDESPILLPVVIAVLAFLPVLICLCKM